MFSSGDGIQKFAGFTKKVLKSCCGGGGQYNYNQLAQCGQPFVTACDDPNMYAYWDGVHFTEAAYRIMFKSLFQGPYTTPQFNLLCPKSTSQVRIGLSGSQMQQRPISTGAGKEDMHLQEKM